MKKLIFSLLSLSAFGHNLSFHKQIILEQGLKVQETLLGGLSGIRYDVSKNLLYAVSDDRARKSPARFYTFDVFENKNGLNFKVKDAIILKTGKGTNYRKGSVDFEDIEILDENNVIITSEGNLMSRYVQPPRVIVFDKSGKYSKDYLVDTKFKPQRENGHFVSGIRDNLAFEPLSFTPDKQHLFTGVEDALQQDGPVASTRTHSNVRLIRYTKTGSGYSPNEEFVYPLGPVSNIETTVQSLAAQSGVPAVLALDKNNLLVMERTYYPLQNRTTVQLFKVTIEEDTTNVQEMHSLIDKKFKYVKKKLFVNFDEFLPKLSKDYRFLDNIEGLALGPKLRNGNQTLIIVSDDNFNKGQRTQFIVFEIKGKL